MITLSVVVVDELGNAGFQIARQIIVFQQYLVLQRAMPALDLALRHRVIRSSSCVVHAALVEPVFEFGAVVGCWNLSAAFIRMKAGLVIRSWALRSR